MNTQSNERYVHVKIKSPATESAIALTRPSDMLVETSDGTNLGRVKSATFHVEVGNLTTATIATYCSSGEAEALMRDTDLHVTIHGDAVESVEFARRLYEASKAAQSSFEEALSVARNYAREGLNLLAVVKRTRDSLILDHLGGYDTQAAVREMLHVEGVASVLND